MSVTERLVTRLATLGRERTASRRTFVASATLGGAALAMDPWGFITRPQSAYASVCGPGASCDAGWSAMCCSINNGSNTCPPNTFPGGWWKADRSSFCGGAARYYIDCNALPGHTFHCHCNDTNCDHRLVACNVFRYGQCNTQIHGTTAVVCRQISCTPPWQLYPGACGRSSATDNNTTEHNAPCLDRSNTYLPWIVYPAAANVLYAGATLTAGQRITSADRHTTCLMQSDGDLVLLNERGRIWSTGTAGIAAGGRAELRPTGRLAVVDAGGTTRWQSPVVTRTGGMALRLPNSGDLMITCGASLVWHTRTKTP